MMLPCVKTLANEPVLLYLSEPLLIADDGAQRHRPAYDMLRLP